MRPSPVQMFVGDRRVAAGRVPRKFISGIVIRVKATTLVDGIAQFPCPFCEQEVAASKATTCVRCEAEFDYVKGEKEVLLIASRNPKAPVI